MGELVPADDLPDVPAPATPAKPARLDAAKAAAGANLVPADDLPDAPAAEDGWAMRNVVKPLVGNVEGYLHKGSQLLAYPIGLAAGAGAYLNPFDRAANTSVVANGDEEAWKRAGQVRRAVENAWTYEPRTEAGRVSSGQLDRGLSTLMRPVTWAADKAGEGTSALYRAAGAAPWQQEAAGDIVRESVPLLAIPAAAKGIGTAGKLLRREPPAAAQAAPAPSASTPAAGATVPGGIAPPVAPSRGLIGTLLREPKPIPEAQYLLDRGVQLTKGQYDPASSYGQVEIASQSKGGVGPLIAKQRHAALAQAMDLGFTEAAPPGSNLAAALKKAGPDINAKYSVLKNAWDEAWDGLRAKGETMYPALHNGRGGVPLASTKNTTGLLDRIINDGGEIWDDASRATAKRFLDNQLTRLPEAKGAVGKVEVGDMLKVSSEIGKKARAALKDPNKLDLAQILGKAKDAVDDAIESQASPELAARLQALRSKYREFKVMEDAVTRTGDSPHGILPSRLSSAVKGADALRSDYASGGGGPLRDLSRAVAKVFDESSAPPTGARLLSAAPSWLNDTLISPTMYLRNAPKAPPAVAPPPTIVLPPSTAGGAGMAGASGLLGALTAPRQLPGPGLSSARRLPIGLTPAAAQEDRR